VEYRQIVRSSRRPSFADVFRSLNRAPFVLGLLGLVSAVFILVGVLAGTSVAPNRGLLTLAAIDAAALRPGNAKGSVPRRHRALAILQVVITAKSYASTPPKSTTA
jgi:hypothetical protein